LAGKRMRKTFGGTKEVACMARPGRGNMVKERKTSVLGRYGTTRNWTPACDERIAEEQARTSRPENAGWSRVP